MNRIKRIIALSLLMPAVLSSFSWDRIGHRVVADVAYHYLTPEARTSVDNVLGYKRAMVDMASWADDIQNDTIYPQQKSWHFQDIDGGMSESYIADLYEHKTKEGFHLFAAKDSLVNVLRADPSNRDALLFIVHLSGDEYQPMHMGHHDDLGGNRVRMTWFGRDTNLHAIWDGSITASTEFSSTELTQHLLYKFSAQHDAYAAMTELECIMRTYQLATFIYNWNEYVKMDLKGQFPRKYEYKYIYAFTPYLEEQLYMAGIQLAVLLNDIYKEVH